MLILKTKTMNNKDLSMESMRELDMKFKIVELFVSSLFGISNETISDLNKKDRCHFEARSFVYLVMTYVFGLPWQRVSGYYGRARRSVFYGIRSAYNLISYMPSYRRKWNQLLQTLLTVFPCLLDQSPAEKEKNRCAIRLKEWNRVLGI